jgi:hypothetical protein
MSGYAKKLVRALAGRKGIVSATRELWEAKIHEEEQHSIVTHLARRLTGVFGYQLLLRTSIRRLQPQLNAHVIVAMDVAGADGVVHDSGRSTSRVVKWFRRMSFGGHDHFVRFNDDDSSASISSGGGNLNRDDVQANVNDDVFSGVRRMWSDFVDDFKCSRQLGSFYRLRAFFPIMFALKRCRTSLIECRSFFRRSFNFTEKCRLVSTTLLIIVLPFLFLIPVQHTNGHEGPYIIPGDCSSLHNRCHIASRCELVSSYPNPTHTCSCPSWLIGSGFDDDPCICQRRFFPIPDYSRDSCVTQMSHLTLGLWVLFMYGMGVLVASGIWSCCENEPFVALVPFLALALGFMIPVALQGFGQPEPVRLCGSELCSSWQQCIDNACVTQCPPVMRARGAACIAGGVGNCSSAATQALCDPSAMCVQLEEGAFACQCPDFFTENLADAGIRCLRNVSCAYEIREFMGSQGNPCHCFANSLWNNKWIPDFERRQCVDKLLRLNWTDYVTFNWLIGIADILLIFYLFKFLYLVNRNELTNEITNYTILAGVITAYALFHGIAFGLGLNPVVPKVACGTSPLDFHLCPTNQQCYQDKCV